VDISGTQISGIKSIAFAMVESSELSTDIGQAENTLVRSVEKIMRDGQVILRLHMQNGALVEYDMRGNKVINNK
jgi:CTP-dependent riboflavin kinase